MDHIIKFGPLIVLLPFSIGLLKLKSMTIERKYLFGAIVLGIVGELLMRIGFKFWNNNLPVMHIYTLIEFSLLVSVFYHGRLKFISKQWYKITLIGFGIAWIGNMLYYQGLFKGISFNRSLEGIILIILALCFFFVLLQRLEFLHPEKTFMFWFSIAILVYFGGNLLVFIFYNHFVDIAAQSEEAKQLIKQIGVITNILNFFLYIFYSIAFLCKESKVIPKSSLSAP